MTDSVSSTLNRSREARATTSSGYVMLLVWLALLAVGIWAVTIVAGSDMVPAGAVGLLIVSIVVGTLILCGFYLINPNEAAAIQLFGTYKGTDRTTGLRWVLPWLTRKKISVRVHNVTSERLKVNDARGNPVEIASNVVWRVADTAQALFDVDDYKHFVEIQIESAVRAIGSKYPYDDLEHKEVTLRGDADVISEELRAELQERVEQAGVVVDECRLTHLAYAPEIAGAMLRRQQAEAVIAARTKLVEGAVTMVEMALHQLSEKQVVELDDERKAAMVSNLMVVLCGERDTQPVVNTGSLYQ
jgi:regulator of protease activity HflC (stomatin/prohibitin superfamily)